MSFWHPQETRLPCHRVNGHSLSFEYLRVVQMLGTFLIGRRAAGACSAALLCVAAALMYSDAAQAARHARHATSRAAPPALDAQAINAAQLPTTSGEKRASAPSRAALIKEEILLDRA